MSLGELTFLAGPALAFLIAAGSPGPATLATAATSMSAGRAAGLRLGAGLAVGLAIWGVVAAAGLGALMIHWAPALFALRIAGAAYLLYLAYRSARSAFRSDAAAARAVQILSPTRLFARGLALNIMNPKAVLAWTAVISIGLPEGGGAVHLIAIVALCACIGLGVYTVYALAFSQPAMMLWYSRTRRWIDASLAALFGSAGIGLLIGRAS